MAAGRHCCCCCFCGGDVCAWVGGVCAAWIAQQRRSPTPCLRRSAGRVDLRVLRGGMETRRGAVLVSAREHGACARAGVVGSATRRVGRLRQRRSASARSVDCGATAATRGRDEGGEATATARKGAEVQHTGAAQSDQSAIRRRLRRAGNSGTPTRRVTATAPREWTAARDDQRTREAADGRGQRCGGALQRSGDGSRRSQRSHGATHAQQNRSPLRSSDTTEGDSTAVGLTPLLR